MDNNKNLVGNNQNINNQLFDLQSVTLQNTNINQDIFPGNNINYMDVNNDKNLVGNNQNINNQLFDLQSATLQNTNINQDIFPGNNINYMDVNNDISLNKLVDMANNGNSVNNDKIFMYDDNNTVINEILNPVMEQISTNSTGVFDNNNNNNTSAQFLKNDNIYENNNLENKIIDIGINNDRMIPIDVDINKMNSQILENDNITEIEGNKNENKKSRKELENKDSNEDSKLIIGKILSNRKFLIILSVIIFIFVTIVVIKTFYYGDKVDGYEEFFTVIDSKDADSIVVSKDDMDKEMLKGDAASELINCINSSLDINKLPDSINLVIDEINSYYNQSNNYFSFVYKDLFTGFTVSYNANQSIFAASSIKAPTDIYIWEMASKGLVNLDEELTYTGNYYNTGSGVLKNKKINTNYSVRTLLGYSTIDSDNAAHNMLMDKYGRGNMLNFWKEKGANVIFTANTNWGSTSGHDAVIYMEELYKFYISDSEYGGAVMNNFINSYPKFLKGKNDYKVASKSGWSGSSLHDMAIVFSDNPYVVVALSNMGDKGGYNSYFNTANDLAYKLHTEYWKYKMDLCNSISQYE